MKKFISALLTLMLVVGLCPAMAVNAEWDGQPATTFAGGTGSDGDPWQIANAAQLKYANELINGSDSSYAPKHYKLTADINFANNDWIPLGRTDARGFQGTFDGGCHVVKNIMITTPGPQYAVNGFFADTGANTVIKNLGIENLTMNIYTDIQTAYIGGFVGRAGGTITNCYIKNSSLTNTGNINEWAAGAFAGSSWGNANITNCYAYDVYMAVKSTPYAFVGKQDAASKYTNCYVADISLKNTNYGLFAKASNATAVNCYSTVTSVGTADDISNVTVTNKPGIVAGIGSGLVSEASINDGYPCMSYQNAAAYDEYEITMFTHVDGVKVRIEENEAVAGAVVYIATYDNDGRLIAAEALDVDTIVTSTLSADAKTIKVFVWDADCKNLALAKVINK